MVEVESRSSPSPSEEEEEAVILLSPARPSPRSYTQYGSTKDTERKLNLVSRGGGGEGQLNEKRKTKTLDRPFGRKQHVEKKL